MSIVVSGATGSLGRLVVEELLSRGIPAGQVVAVGRSVDRLADLADRGVRTVHVDYDHAETWADALAEGDTLLLVSGTDVRNRLRQHTDAVRAAHAAGVARIVYTSATRADDTELVLAPDHKATEAAIRESGVPFTILRNNWYVENYAQALASAAETGELVAGVGDGRVAGVPRRDYAAAIAGALTQDGHEGATYELGGDTAWSYDDLAVAFGEVLGRDVTYRSVTPEELVAGLTAEGLDVGTAGFVAALDGNIRRGALDHPGDDLARLAGRPATPLVEGVRQMREAS